SSEADNNTAFRESPTCSARAALKRRSGRSRNVPQTQVTRISAKPLTSAESTAMLQPCTLSWAVELTTTEPGPWMIASPSLTASTLTTALVLQIGKLSPDCAMKRVPSGMQSLVGPSVVMAEALALCT